jgi:hypothetical protein
MPSAGVQSVCIALGKAYGRLRPVLLLRRQHWVEMDRIAGGHFVVDLRVVLAPRAVVVLVVGLRDKKGG